MIGRIERSVAVLALALAGLTGALAPGSASCERLRFVFLADSRSEQPTVKDPTPYDLINTAVLDAINKQILALSPRPSFVVFGGDMAYRGRYDGVYTFPAFRNVMAPLTAAGIKLYTAVGNHELYQHPGSSGFYIANQEAFQLTFTDNPGNGPPGYERLAYSFQSPGGDAFFAVLDPYYLTADQSLPPGGDPEADTGAITAAQLAWLQDEVGKTSATHKFLFVHTPYYSVYTLPPSNDASYTRLWQILDDNRFDAYLCGHIHLYSRKTVDGGMTPNPQVAPPVHWRNNVVQVLTGTAGAGVDTAPPVVDPIEWHVANKPGQYYFTVVDIDGAQVLGTTYVGGTGSYAVLESFAIPPFAPIPTWSTWSAIACAAALVALATFSLRRRAPRPR